MRRLLPLLILLLSLGACENPSFRTAAEHLGPGAACTWLRQGADNREIACIYHGTRYVCLVRGGAASCAVLSVTAPEGK